MGWDVAFHARYDLVVPPARRHRHRKIRRRHSNNRLLRGILNQNYSANVYLFVYKFQFDLVSAYLLCAFHLENKCKYCLHCMYIKTAPPVKPTATTTSFVQKGHAARKTNWDINKPGIMQSNAISFSCNIMSNSAALRYDSCCLFFCGQSCVKVRVKLN